MASLGTVSIGILFGALLVLAGILSSLVALRFGAPLLLVFLIFGMLAGEEGPGGLRSPTSRSASAGPNRCWSARWSPRPTQPRCSS